MKKRWVIVFLIYADFRQKKGTANDNILPLTDEMKNALNQMFKDILTVPLDDELARLYVIWSSIGYKTDPAQPIQSKTAFYEVGNPRKLPYNEIVECDVIDFDHVPSQGAGSPGQVQNPELLGQILDKIHLHADEEVFFVTHDHGSGFGIFREATAAQVLTPVHHEIDQYPYLAKFWNTALIADPQINEMIANTAKAAAPDYIKLGHAFFRLEPVTDGDDLWLTRQLMAQKSVPSTSPGVKNRHLKPLIGFNQSTNAFEILNSDLINLADGHITQVAELIPEEIGDILTNDELALVFQKWLAPGEKIGVLLMMNCWMMNMHTMYSFFETVNHLVAPQSEIGVPGYNYKAILRCLNKEAYRKVTSRELAIKCVTSIETKRMRKRSVKLREDKADIIDMWKVFAFDLQVKDRGGKFLLMNQIEALERLIDTMNRMTSTGDPALEARFMYKYVRSVSFDFSDNTNMMIDIVNWCLSLMYADAYFILESKTRLGIGGVRKELIAFKEQLFRRKKFPTLNLCSTSGKSVYLASDDPFDPTSVIGLDPKGYGLFFPMFEIQSSGLHRALLGSLKTDKLLIRLTKWKEFLRLHIDPAIDY